MKPKKLKEEEKVTEKTNQKVRNQSYLLVQPLQLKQRDWLQHFFLPVEAIHSHHSYPKAEENWTIFNFVASIKHV